MFLGTDMFCIFDIKNLSAARWVKTKRVVLCTQVFQNGAYWAGEEGLMFYLEVPTNLKTVQVIKADDVTDTFQTNYKDSITSITINSDKILIGKFN